MSQKDNEYYARNREKLRAQSRARRAANPEAKRERDRRYREAHSDKLRAWFANYRETQRETIRARDRGYYAADAEAKRAKARKFHAEHAPEINEKKRLKNTENPEPNRTRALQWQKENRAQVTAKQRAYRALHPEMHRMRNGRRRDKVRGVRINDLTVAQWQMIQETQDHRCAYCGKRAKGRLHREHLTPVSEGGSTTLHNIVAACRQCNSKKGTGPVLKPIQPFLL